VVISAPFGNYVQPADATPTLGTFTAAARPGRVWRIVKTVRYYPRLKAWVNKIGLRNPGLPWLLQRVEAGKIDVRDKLVSVHGFTADDWWALLAGIERIRPLGVELNMSCPNVGHIDWPPDLFSRAMQLTGPDGHLPGVVVKLPPVNYGDMLAQAIDAGVRCFHCCNTLPVPAGGVSGKPLKPVSLTVIRALRARPFGKELTIIGGGGIYEASDIDDYRDAGADHFALGTKVMHPKYLWSARGVRGLIDRAGG